MPREPEVPNKTQLEAYLRKGLTQQQIAEQWEKDSGVRVGRTAIANAISRYGLKSARPRDRHMELVPWRVKVEHRNHPDVRVLRLESRRRKGEPISDRDLTWLNNWLTALDEENAVVAYDPRLWPEGFAWVPRTKEDDDIIRRPVK